jgi:hypothetical protein
MNFVRRHPYQLLMLCYGGISAFGWGTGHWDLGVTNGVTALLFGIIAFRKTL